MKTRLLSTILRVGLPTLTRHLLAAGAGLFAVSPDADMTTWVVAILTWLLAWIWSVAERRWAWLKDIENDIVPDIDRQALLQQSIRAASSQIVATLSGVLLEHGFTGDPNDTLAVATFSGNYLHSLALRGKGNTPPSPAVTSSPTTPPKATVRTRTPFFRR
jgi:hypothetical protein